MKVCEVIKLEEENKSKKINFKKIMSEAITASIVIVICTIIIGAIFIVVSPNIEFKQDYNSGKDNKNEVQNSLSKIEEALVRVYSEYIEEVSYEDLVEGAISGIAQATGDPYTRYITEEEFQDMLVEGTETYVGIGVHLTFDLEKNGIQILGIMPNSPALDAELKAGDIIYYVDDMRVTYENYMDAIDVIKGEENTVVKLIIERNGKIIEKEVTRKKVQTNNISSELINGNIGYIKIWAFENEIYDQFKKEYDKLRAQNIKGLVIDLRNNPGGFVDQALLIANMFVPECEALKLVSREGVEKTYKTTSKTEIDIPLTILVNENSASSSEILSAIVKDANKGVIIGTKTYGKGIVQTTKQLSFGGALSITTAKYYTESVIEIHKNGIEQNILVEQSEEYKNEIVVPYDKDLQLQAAIKYINENN